MEGACQAEAHHQSHRVSTRPTQLMTGPFKKVHLQLATWDGESYAMKTSATRGDLHNNIELRKKSPARRQCDSQSVIKLAMVLAIGLGQYKVTYPFRLSVRDHIVHEDAHAPHRSKSLRLAHATTNETYQLRLLSPMSRISPFPSCSLASSTCFLHSNTCSDGRPCVRHWFVCAYFCSPRGQHTLCSLSIAQM